MENLNRGYASVGATEAAAEQQPQLGTDRFHHFVDVMRSSELPLAGTRLDNHQMMMLTMRMNAGSSTFISGHANMYVGDHNPHPAAAAVPLHHPQHQAIMVEQQQGSNRGDGIIDGRSGACCRMDRADVDSAEPHHRPQSTTQYGGGADNSSGRSFGLHIYASNGDGAGHAAAAAEERRSTAVAIGGRSRYESQKRRDWNTFGQYVRNMGGMPLSKCSGEHVLQFLRYLDQFGKTRIHVAGCPYFGRPEAAAGGGGGTYGGTAGGGTCGCPLRQAWGSLDALVGRLRAAFEEHVGAAAPDNPFAAKIVRLYLRQVRDAQAKARGISHQKKQRKRAAQPAAPATAPPPIFPSSSATCNHPQF